MSLAVVGQYGSEVFLEPGGAFDVGGWNVQNGWKRLDSP